MNPLMNPVGSNAEGKLNCINAVVITQIGQIFLEGLFFYVNILEENTTCCCVEAMVCCYAKSFEKRRRLW